MNSIAPRMLLDLRRPVALLLLLGLSGAPRLALAHWCSNIWAAPAKLVVKPEQDPISVTAGTPTTLKVYLQNNFPWTLFKAQMRGTASGYTTTVSPSQQDVGPGQNVLFTLSITKSSGSGSVSVSSLSLQVNFRYSDASYSWRSLTDTKIDQSPSQSTVTNLADYDNSQGASLAAAVLADKYPSATLSSMLNRTGLQQLINWFGYRFCYSSSGSYRCGSQACPSACAEGASWSSTDQFPQNCLRAGAELAARKAKLGSQLTEAQKGAINAMSAGGDEHKCMAAVVGGLLHQGASSTSAFTSALSNVSSNCKAAGLRALGQGSASSCTSGQEYEKAACAAAEGLQGNDTVVKSVLIPNAGDGNTGGYDGLYYSYMLYIVTWDRYGQGKYPSFYPKVGNFEGGTVTADTGPKPDIKPPWDGWVAPDGGGVTPGREAGGTSGDGKFVPHEAEGGCGCEVGAGTAAAGGAGLALVVLLVLGAGLARRRR
jgi:MYXO-CTERM domain-containing protein